MTDLGRVCPKATLGCEAFTANVTMEGPVFGPLDLRVVVPQVLLQIRQLDEGSSAVWQVAFVRPFALTHEKKFSKSDHSKRSYIRVRFRTPSEDAYCFFLLLIQSTHM